MEKQRSKEQASDLVVVQNGTLGYNLPKNHGQLVATGGGWVFCGKCQSGVLGTLQELGGKHPRADPPSC
jgi:hypothetical protein